jgi:hypothetical protein
MCTLYSMYACTSMYCKCTVYLHMLCQWASTSTVQHSVAEPHHVDAASAPDDHFDEAPALATTLHKSESTF